MITRPVFALVLFSVGCSALAQISLKHGMAQPAMQQLLGSRDIWRIPYGIASSPSVLGGLFLYGFSAIVWLFVLARLDVSVAYPFVSLGFLATMALGCLLLGESFSLGKTFGTVMVMLGVYLVAAAQ